MSTIGTDLDRHIACLLDKQKDGSSLCYSVFTYGRPSIQSVIRKSLLKETNMQLAAVDAASMRRALNMLTKSSKQGTVRLPGESALPSEISRSCTEFKPSPAPKEYKDSKPKDQIRISECEAPDLDWDELDVEELMTSSEIDHSNHAMQQPPVISAPPKTVNIDRPARVERSYTELPSQNSLHTNIASDCREISLYQELAKVNDQYETVVERLLRMDRAHAEWRKLYDDRESILARKREIQSQFSSSSQRENFASSTPTYNNNTSAIQDNTRYSSYDDFNAPSSTDMARDTPQQPLVTAKDLLAGMELKERVIFGHVDYIESTNEKEWKKVYQWTAEMEAINRQVFKNSSFRPMQREIINATMSGRDVFVLMPTGGGKSLCYQLPAVFCAPAVTIVISPLVSLIQDQVIQLGLANVNAAQFSRDGDWSEHQEIYRDLESSCPSIRMLYCTPEKISQSGRLMKCLEDLHSRQLLARVVIDEGHCISSWGNDFRADYRNLVIFKKKFKDVPVMALTATATISVREDVVRSLGLKKCCVFQSSFNRPNLFYEVRPKRLKSFHKDIYELIKTDKRLLSKSGIIYCGSKKECELLSESLNEKAYGDGVRAIAGKVAYYHAGLSTEDRNQIQLDWMNNKYRILCATIAFGMGINKPDVRFVMHASLAKSIEGYHQECGRAGRDGYDAMCILFYNFNDSRKIRHMIEMNCKDNGHSPQARQQRDVNLENLRKMIAFCENHTDCLRQLQLAHFSQDFNPEKECRGRCGNCIKQFEKGCSIIKENMSELARKIVSAIIGIRDKVTSVQLVDILKGAKTQKVKQKGYDRLPEYGYAKALSKTTIEKTIHHMIILDILTEITQQSEHYGTINTVIAVNHKVSHKLTQGSLQVIIKSISGESMASTNTESKKGGSRSNKSSKIDQEMERKLRLALGRARKTCSDQICGGKVSLTSIFPETEIYSQARALCSWYKNNGVQIDAGQYVQNIVSDGYRSRGPRFALTFLEAARSVWNGTFIEKFSEDDEDNLGIDLTFENDDDGDVARETRPKKRRCIHIDDDDDYDITEDL